MTYRQRARRLAENMLPDNTVRRKVASKTYNAFKRYILGKKIHQPIISYNKWIAGCEPKIWVTPKRYKQQPLISLVVPAYNTPEKYLRPLFDSITSQLYENWQLCIADGSTNKERAVAIAAACATDARITYKKLKKNYGIVRNTNEAIKLARGTFVGFVDHDDVLSPHALLEVVDALNQKPKTDFFYSDEDKLSENGKVRSLPFFKPDWSPSLLEGVNYITHFMVVRKTVIDKIGALRTKCEGSQDYDFILRATDHTQNIVHIPKILYHWRIADGSTAGPIENKSYANDAGVSALRDHVKRQKIQATVDSHPHFPTNYRLKYNVPGHAKASIIIPFKDKAPLTKRCVESILQKTTYNNYEIILISNNSVQKKTKDFIDEIQKDPRVRFFEYNKPFNYSAINNFGRKQATGKYIVLLNNDTAVISPDWLGEMLSVAAQPWAGAVGPMLLYPNNKIQHAGVVVGKSWMADHVFRMLREDGLTMFGRPYWPRNYLAVTAACLAVTAKKYDEVGGLDEKLVMCGNDVALGIRLHQKGYRNVYWPFVKLYHYENVSVGSYSKAPIGDFNRSLTYYSPYFDNADPYFNPNLEIVAGQHIVLRKQYEQAN